MALVPTGANTIGYSLVSLINTSSPSTAPSQRQLTFGITGASYQGSTGISSSYIGSTGATGLFYIRDLNGNLSDVFLNTDSSGSTSVNFLLDKIRAYSLALLYTRDPGNFYVPNSGGDFTTPVPIVMPTFPILPNGYFSVAGQSVVPTGVTGATVNLTQAYYEGYPGGTTSSYISVYHPSSIVGSSGTTASVSGTQVGTLYYNDQNGNASGNITHNEIFDVPPYSYYMIYNMNDTDKSANYVGLTGIDLPFSVNNLVYQTGTTGVSLTMYNASYNFIGLTGTDSVIITDFQDSTTGSVQLNLNAQGIPYATWFFGPTGGTAQVIPGSTIQYSGATAFSHSYVSIPSHHLSSEGITGNLVDLNIQGSNLVEALTLRNFNYFDQDGNSIFNTFNKQPDSGIINLVSSYGTTGILYTGPTGNFTGSGVTFSGIHGYNVAFADPVPIGPQLNQRFELSFDDSSIPRGSTATLFYNWLGMIVYPEVILVNNLTSSSGSKVSLTFSSFDYLDDHGFSIFGPTGHTGYIEVYGPPFVGTSGLLVGRVPYSGYTGPYTINTNTVINYQVPVGLFIAFNDITAGIIRTKLKLIIVEWQKETLQFVVYEQPLSSSGLQTIELGSLDYFDGSGNSLIYGQWGATGYIELMGPTGMISQQQVVADRNHKYIFTY